MTYYALAYAAIFVFNAVWFGAAFHYFALKPFAAAKLLVPKAARGSPLFTSLAESGRFLGGMNFAFSTFALLLLSNRALFAEPRQLALFATVFALAHGSQFAFNVRIALGKGPLGQPLWAVLQGPMLFIFCMDCVLMLANGALAALLLTT